MPPKLPQDFRQRTTTIKMERVLSLPKVRRALVKEFIPDLDDDEVNRVVSKFTLRNIPLYPIDLRQYTEIDLSEDVDVIYQRFRGIVCKGTSQDYIPYCKKTPALFAEFERAYVKAGNRILADKEMGSRFDLEWLLKDYQEYAGDFLAP
ncbi:hypothetical protein HRG_010381 [Hirsutella rhossiliensis]|uniref:Uncharacterized protein n=1 Tax=Hirsutella rhossiliensis TaxID=111463 RepID=A0A9P8MQM8_9HYPO|nr:uncharacterized protein HRG_10381 [Hirsutella rhossiliensis]KAH0958694.1 hypothetical protein HRG_10381 [Hirsutella rhossiliensis]